MFVSLFFKIFSTFFDVMIFCFYLINAMRMKTKMKKKKMMMRTKRMMMTRNIFFFFFISIETLISIFFYCLSYGLIFIFSSVLNEIFIFPSFFIFTYLGVLLLCFCSLIISSGLIITQFSISRPITIIFSYSFIIS